MANLANGKTVVFGFGAVGRVVVRALLARGGAVRVAQRSRPADLPAAAEFVACDVIDAAAVRHAVEGCAQVVLAVGFPYDTKLWRSVWPATMTNLVDACAASGARMVFVDNLYMLGPQTGPRHEDMPLLAERGKGRVLAEVTGIWKSAAAAGRVRVAALRCTDFYGPEVVVSHLGSSAFGPLVRGKTALLVAPPDTPHDFAYVPDIARAVVSLLDAGDDAFGEVWNMPCAPTRTPRELLQIGADALGVQLKLVSIPLRTLPVLGVVSSFMREVDDVRFTFDRPYEVDGGKFMRRFSFVPTPYEIGVASTARSFVSSADSEVVIRG